MAKKAKGKTSLGLDENIEGALCYIGWWVTGLIFYILEKDNKFVRFHAMQSILVFIAITILGIIINAIGWIAWQLWFITWILGLLVWALGFIVWLILMLKAYQGEKFKLPIVGDIANKKA